MTHDEKRIEARLPEESFALVASAAAKMGLSLRGFASMAIYRTAVSVLKAEAELMPGAKGTLRLSPEEIRNLAKIFADPFQNAERIAKAHERASAIPHREVPESERL